MDCKDCLFAKVDGEVQVGCEFGRLERFAEENIELTLKDGFFHTDGLLGCSTKRDKSWEHAGRSKEVQIENVMNSFNLKYDMLFWYKDGDLQQLLDGQLWDIRNSNVKPSNIIVAFYDSPTISKPKLINSLKSCGIPWVIIRQNVGGGIPELIDAGFKSVKSPHFYCANIAEQIDLNLSRKVQLAAQTFHSTLVVYYDDYNFFSNSILFESTMGFEEAESVDDDSDMSNYLTKAKYLSADQNKPHMVKTDAELETLMINLNPPSYLAREYNDIYGIG